MAKAFDAAPQSWAVSFLGAAPPDADVLVFAEQKGSRSRPASGARPEPPTRRCGNLIPENPSL